MFGTLPLGPAYGRDYSSVKAAQIDFDLDKDFTTASGQYINRAQLITLPGSFHARGKIECRNADKTKVFMLTL
jgi:hypothetical protein